MIRIYIKPLSVNRAWRGKRFKTNEYKIFEQEVLLKLPNIELPQEPFKVTYQFGFSNMQSDIDNPIKPIQDILQKKYGFNDSKIHELNVHKHKVAKGLEYFEFKIETKK